MLPVLSAPFGCSACAIWIAPGAPSFPSRPSPPSCRPPRRPR
jgi:hypothetical protein